MPIPIGEHVSGSGTPEDPELLSGHLDVTLKPGTPFVLPIAYFYGETYDPALGLPPDPVLPVDVFDASYVRITLDGKPIIDSAREDKYRYFVPPTLFETPIVYNTPTDYGATSAIYFEGFAMVHPPLSKGTHTLTLESSIILPPGIYPNIPDGLGVRFANTWTITVK